MEAKVIIERFIDKYNTCQPNKYHISRWPDEENRNQRDIDAFDLVQPASVKDADADVTMVRIGFGFC